MPNYNQTITNSYLNNLLHRFNPTHWAQHPTDDDLLVMPTGIENAATTVTNGTGLFYQTIFKELTHTNTRRWIFDSDQAVEFSQLGMNPAQENGSIAIAPFPRFYMEFTNPLTGVIDQEPGYTDATTALIFREDFEVVGNNKLLVDIKTVEPILPTISLSSATFFLQSFFTGEDTSTTFNPIIKHNHDVKEQGTYYTDRTFKIHLPTGQAWVTPATTSSAMHDLDSKNPVEHVVTEKDGKRLHEEASDNLFIDDIYSNREAISRANLATMDKPNEDITSELPDEWLTFDNMTKYYPAMATIEGMENRRIGYWEHVAQQYCDMFIWMLMYISSKQIITTVIQPPRAERKRIEKRGETPQPWHVITINPKLIVNLNNTDKGTGTSPGHRFDVRAHWKRQTIRYGPGRTLSKNVTQYIPSHMRGLKNEIYIPGTRDVE